MDLEGREDGLALLRDLLAQGHRVLMFSGYHPALVRRRTGRRDLPHLEKPFLAEELLAAVEPFTDHET